MQKCWKKKLLTSDSGLLQKATVTSSRSVTSKVIGPNLCHELNVSCRSMPGLSDKPTHLVVINLRAYRLSFKK